MAAWCASVLMLQCSQNSEERNYKNKQRLSHSIHQGLQRVHPLSSRLIDSCYGCTCKKTYGAFGVCSLSILKADCLHWLYIESINFAKQINLSNKNKLTCKNPTKQWTYDAHEQDGDGENSCHLMSPECCDSQEGSGQVEHQWGHNSPQEHTIPHLCQKRQLRLASIPSTFPRVTWVDEIRLICFWGHVD